MRVAGTRRDGALWIDLGGIAVVLRADRCSPPVDPKVIESLGGWDDAHGVSGADRRELSRRLERARMAPIQSFQLDRRVRVEAQQGKRTMSFEYGVTGEDAAPDEKPVGTDVPAEAPAEGDEDPTPGSVVDETDAETEDAKDPKKDAVVLDAVPPKSSAAAAINSTEAEEPTADDDEAEEPEAEEDVPTQLRRRLRRVLALGDRSKYPGGYYPNEQDKGFGGEHSAAHKDVMERVDQNYKEDVPNTATREAIGHSWVAEELTEKLPGFHEKLNAAHENPASDADRAFADALDFGPVGMGVVAGYREGFSSAKDAARGHQEAAAALKSSGLKGADRAAYAHEQAAKAFGALRPQDDMNNEAFEETDAAKGAGRIGDDPGFDDERMPVAPYPAGRKVPAENPANALVDKLSKIPGVAKIAPKEAIRPFDTQEWRKTGVKSDAPPPMSKAMVERTAATPPPGSTYRAPTQAELAPELRGKGSANKAKK